MADRSWFTIQANGRKDAPASIYLYDEIGMWGVTAGDFARELRQVDADAIDLFINSPGGAAFDAYAIYNNLKAHKATIRAVVDGMAASAASVVAMAADRIVMRRPSAMMIHNPYSTTTGDAASHTKTAEDLARITDQIVDVYATRSGADADEIRTAMEIETWYDESEAVAAGLADEVGEAQPNNLTTGRVFNLAPLGFHNVPATVPTAPAERHAEPIRIDTGFRRQAVAAYLDHHDDAGRVDVERARLVLARATNLAIPVENREATIKHLEAHMSQRGKL